jgi:hypothetical protein
VIRVVIVEEDHDWFPFFSTDPNATAAEILQLTKRLMALAT